MNIQIDTLLRLYLKEQSDIICQFPVDEVVKLTEIIRDCYDSGGRVFTFGNGGGAGIASHFASDLLMHPFVTDDKHTTLDIERLRVYCLNDSVSLITRIGNDLGYKNIFVDQLMAFGLCVLDIVVIFSTSGNSPNILSAIRYLRDCGATTVLVGGRDGGKAKERVDLCILIPGHSEFPGQTGANDNNFHIEDFQGIIAHMVTGLMKGEING